MNLRQRLKNYMDKIHYNSIHNDAEAMLGAAISVQDRINILHKDIDLIFKYIEKTQEILNELKAKKNGNERT